MSEPRCSLTILAAHPQQWSRSAVQEFQDGVSSLLAEIERRMQSEHLALRLQPQYLAVGGTQGASRFELQRLFAFAILDVTDYDEELASVAGFMRGARIPFAFVCQTDAEAATRRRSQGDARVISYQARAELFRPDSLLYREVLQAISQARVLEELVYELWFPRETSTIWIVCPQIHEPGEFADRSSSDYTYLDNLGDTDALLEIMVFLSRYYPKSSIEKFSAVDLPRDHTKSNLVVIGGPGSADGISNQVCQEMMKSMKSRVSYSADCERMFIASDDKSLELRADLHSDTPGLTRPDNFNVQQDYGYFARFPNPLNAGATVVLVNGIHTAGVLGAARVFADRPEALLNFDSVFKSGANPRSFECYFEVGVLHGEVGVPNVPDTNIHSLGSTKKTMPNALNGEKNDKGRPRDEDESVTVMFVAGDRGGFQRNQIQIPTEFHSIQDALQACKHRDRFQLAPPILAATTQRFVESYRHHPAILHFAGHGDDRSLSFILDQGLLVTQTPLIAERLAAILRNFPERIRLCVLNTCESAPVAKHLVDEQVVDAAIGWSTKVDDATAIAFSKALYGRIGDGLALPQSVTLAAESSGSKEAPILYTDERWKGGSFLRGFKNESCS